MGLGARARGDYVNFTRYGGKTYLGFGAHSWRFSRAGSGRTPTNVERNIIFPLWAPAGLLGIAPFFWLRGIWRRSRDMRSGLCSRCGYDLRASRERCPECGSVMGAAEMRQVSWPRELWLIPAVAVLLGALGAAGARGAMRHVEFKRTQWARAEQVKEATERAFEAARSDDEEELRRQIQAGANLSGVRGGEQMFVAIQNYKSRIAAIFLQAGADVRLYDGLAIVEAASRRYYFLVLRLAENGADVNVRHPGAGRTALHSCAAELEFEDQLEVAAALLKRGADPNMMDDLGETPLHRLTEPDPQVNAWDRTEFARLLIAGGADVNARNKEGQTPLKLAKTRQREALAEFLISKGARE